MELYHGAAEDLPENTHTHDVDADIDKDHEESTVHCPDDASIADLFNWTPEAAISERAAHFIGPNASAPRRHLPPGKPTTLYWQFLAWYESIRDVAGSSGINLPFLSNFPSWTTFHRRWMQKWAHVLAFRKTSQHKECSMCHDFRCQIHRRGLSTAEKVAIARQFREHTSVHNTTTGCYIGLFAGHHVCSRMCWSSSLTAWTRSRRCTPSTDPIESLLISMA